MRKITGFFMAVLLAISFVTAQTITSMSPSNGQGPVLQADAGGGSGFTFPIFNGGSATFEQVGGDLAVFVQQGSNWVGIDGNAGSGWVYDQNWGHFWEGGGGFWFRVEETTKVRLQSKANNGVYLDYTINYTAPVRTDYKLTPREGTQYSAGDDGAIGVPLPHIDGSPAIQKEIDNFVYEVKIGGNWVALTSASDFQYQANGYSNTSAKNQWGYWTGGGIWGLWFQPITENYDIRIGYPTSNTKGGAIGDNWVEYKFIGNPNAPRPDPVTGSIVLGTTDNWEIPGWKLIWNDEFTDNHLDESKWNYEVGYFLNDDPGTWGFGNEELQHYTNSTNNVFVEDGKLNLKAFPDPKSGWSQNPGQVAPYSSGKIFSKDKYSFKYGRIDFCVKLPTIQGTWPACWMMPQDEIYGGWALSGEIDVMEAKGRLPNGSSGAIHFGGAWPDNKYIDGEYHFEEGNIGNFNVYSVVWEKESIKWYVNGKCFFIANNNQWKTKAVSEEENPFAPFDQEFFVIMNLAIGGWFDKGAVLNPADFPATMQIDYVRVYEPCDTCSGGVTAINKLANKKALTASFAGITNGQINLRLADGNYNVELYDLQGRQISKVNLNAINGVNATGLKTDKLSKGVVVLNVKKGNNSVLQQKILIK